MAASLLARGLPPETHVIICMPRGDELVVALLGVMLAGLTYVPVEPSTPAARRAAIAQQCNPGPMLTSMPPHDDRRWQDAHTTFTPVDGGQLAYTIFTSGSSGTPKGVSLPHEALTHFLQSADRLLDIGRPRRVLAATSIAFDVAALELFWSLTRGHTVCVATEADLADPCRLLALIVDQEIDLVQATPSRWAILASTGTVPAGITALSGGEALPRALAGGLLRSGVELLNFYGPTETCVYSTAGAVESADLPIAIGDALGETTVSVRSPHGRPLPHGTRGELWIGGPGLARGYLGDPRRTAAAFVPDDTGPFGQRAYRTGDQAVRGPHGIEFAGRTDDQVKLHGARVELGDIELAVRQVPGVVLAAAIVVSASLWVFYTSVDGELIPRIDEFVARELPPYMCPDGFLHLAAMPLTPSGKADRGALRAQPRAAGPHNESRTTAELIGALLGHAIGVDEDIFAHGASSLAVAQLAVRIERQFGVSLSVGDIAKLRTTRAIEMAIRRTDSVAE
ncbi:non-ribosomal peptide synthetase [Streptomyces sp. SID13588]|nr:non-ribosomal peptide synthetase [Streptomyces sp. SID13588]